MSEDESNKQGPPEEETQLEMTDAERPGKGGSVADSSGVPAQPGAAPAAARTQTGQPAATAAVAGGEGKGGGGSVENGESGAPSAISGGAEQSKGIVPHETRQEARQTRAAEKREVETLITRHRNSHNRARIAWAVVHYVLSSLSLIFAVATIVVLDLDSVKDWTIKKDWATGFAAAGAVAVIFSRWLGQEQRARKNADSLSRLDVLRVKLTKPEVDFSEIREKFEMIIEERGGDAP
jgi:hypothetical protein